MEKIRRCDIYNSLKTLSGKMWGESLENPVGKTKVKLGILGKTPSNPVGK